MGLDSLAEIFEVPLDRITRDIVTSQAINWGNDAFARGAYSYATPKTREEQSALRKPDGGAVFFSGEALYAGRIWVRRSGARQRTKQRRRSWPPDNHDRNCNFSAEQNDHHNQGTPGRKEGHVSKFPESNRERCLKGAVGRRGKAPIHFEKQEIWLRHWLRRMRACFATPKEIRETSSSEDKTGRISSR